MRDAGLSAKAWMDVNNNDYNAVREVMEGYAKWTGIVQHKADPNDIDVRVEPKFTIPDGDPYTGERWWSLPVLSSLLIRRLVSAPD